MIENPSEACQVLFGWNVVRVGLPMLKLINDSGGRASYPGGPEGMMPSVPSPVTKPKSDTLPKPAVGWSVITAERVKLSRASFTAAGPRSFVLLKTACCAREGVTVGNPGTLDAASGFVTVASSNM